MTGPKTNERPGTRAVLKHAWVSAPKVRVVLDLIRGLDVQSAREVLRFSERDAAQLVGKLLDSAIANAEHNDNLVPDELYVSACFADEGRTNKRWRPRARGRATRIRKRTSHVTVIVSRLPDDRLARLRAKQAAEASTRRARRVAGGRKASQAVQADAREGSRLRRRRRGGEDETPETLAETVEEVGIVDQQAVAAEAIEEAEVSETAPESGGELAEEIQEEGIVDQQAAAAEAVEDAEPAEESAPEEPGDEEKSE
jgi:large subunit ribosomal protein L22